MARRAPNGIPRPRDQRVVVDADGAARRPSGAGFIVIGCVVLVAAFLLLGAVAGRIWGHR